MYRIKKPRKNEALHMVAGQDFNLQASHGLYTMRPTTRWAHNPKFPVKLPITNTL